MSGTTTEFSLVKTNKQAVYKQNTASLPRSECLTLACGVGELRTRLHFSEWELSLCSVFLY